MRNKISIALVALAMLISLLVACAKPALSPASSPAPSPTLAPTPSQTPTQKAVEWKICLQGPPRSIFYPYDWWSEEMKKRTNGLFNIKIYYNQVLAPVSEFPDGIKKGAFEGAGIVFGQHPAKTLLSTAIELPFLMPKSISKQGYLITDFHNHPDVKKELANWNAMYFAPVPAPLYQMMTNKPVTSLGDLKGLRLRATGGSGDVLAKFGAVATMIPGAEMYEAMQRGTIDGVCAGWTYAYESYKIYEVAKYATIDLDLGAVHVIVAVSIAAFNALPKEWQDIMMSLREEIIRRSEVENDKADEQNLVKFKQAGVQISSFPTQDRAKLVEAGGTPVWEDWVKRMTDNGLPGGEVLDYIKQLAKKYS